MGSPETDVQTLVQTGTVEDAKVLKQKRFTAHRGHPRKMSREERQRATYRFAELLALGYNQTDAALRAGFGSNRRSATTIGGKLARSTDVQRLIALAKERVDIAPPTPEEIKELDADWVIRRLQYEAQHSESPAARVRALELLGKVKDIYAPDRSEVAHVGTMFADVPLDDDPPPPQLGQTAHVSDGESSEDPDLV